MLTYNLSDYLSLPKTTGAYCIFNKTNSKIYVGGTTFCEGFYRRFVSHVNELKNNTHERRDLQKDFNEVGIENFLIAILQVCEPDEAWGYEQYFLDTLNPDYNKAKSSTSSLGIKHSCETREEMGKDFYLISPEGEVYEGNNLVLFVEKQGHPSRRDLCKLLHGKLKHSFGWTTSWENHLKYKELYEMRGIVWYERLQKYRVNHYKDSGERTTRHFKTLEEAKEFRDAFCDRTGYRYVIKFY